MRIGLYKVKELKRDDSVLSVRTIALALALHLAFFIFFWITAKILNRPPDVIIPIDMTIVPPWAQQTDDPDPDPNPHRRCRAGSESRAPCRPARD